MKYTLILIMLLTCLGKSFCQDNWKLAKNDQGIKVYVGEIINSEFFAFKAVMSVKSTEQQILKILKDVNMYNKWFAFTESVKLIKQSDNHQLFEMETYYPWPFANECMKYSMDFERTENESLKIVITGSRENVNCKYSLKKASGYILLESENGGTKITYYFHSEPSQKIPTTLINSMIYKMPFRTFISLKKLF